MRSLARALHRPPALEVRIFGLQDLQTTIDLPAWEGLPVDVFPVLGPRSFGYTNALGYLSPVQFEDQHAQQTVKPAA